MITSVEVAVWKLELGCDSSILVQVPPSFNNKMGQDLSCIQELVDKKVCICFCIISLYYEALDTLSSIFTS